MRERMNLSKGFNTRLESGNEDLRQKIEREKKIERVLW